MAGGAMLVLNQGGYNAVKTREWSVRERLGYRQGQQQTQKSPHVVISSSSAGLAFYCIGGAGCGCGCGSHVDRCSRSTATTFVAVVAFPQLVGMFAWNLKPFAQMDFFRRCSPQVTSESSREPKRQCISRPPGGSQKTDFRCQRIRVRGHVFVRLMAHFSLFQEACM